jgi:hypothetical protein
MAVELGLWGIIGLVHGARSVYDSLSYSESVQSLGNKNPQSKLSPTSITRDGWDIEAGLQHPSKQQLQQQTIYDIELLEAGLLHSSKQQTIYDQKRMTPEQIHWGNTSVIMDQSGRIYDSHYRELDLHMWNNGIVLHKNRHIVNDDSSSDEILLGDEILPGDV